MTPEQIAEPLSAEDDLMLQLAVEGDPRFAELAGRAYIRIRTLQRALAAIPATPDVGLRERDLAVAHGWITYDAADRWLVETDKVGGAAQIVARDVPDWFGHLVAAALSKEPSHE